MRQLQAFSCSGIDSGAMFGRPSTAWGPLQVTVATLR